MEIGHQMQHRILTSQNMALHGIHRSLSKDMSMDTVAYLPTKMWELMMIGAAFYCPDGPSSAKWFIGKHEPITEGIAVATYGIPSAGVNVTYQYYDKTSGSS